MITQFKMYEKIDRGETVLYTLKTKAKTYSESEVYEYDVNILEGDSGLVLSIQSTPGSWYIETLLDTVNYDKLSISGSDWTCDNWTEVSKELVEILPKLELMLQAKKYKWWVL